MSKITLAPNAAGTGTLTIAAPSTSADRTLTLPDETGTVLSNASALDPAKLTGGAIVTDPAKAVGYSTGAGGAVTQATSRTTSVTLNKPAGQITMVSAAGSTSWSEFLVNNSTVAATDAVILNVRNNSNSYALIARPTSGGFYVSFQANSNVVDAPVINFVVIKGAVA